MTKRASLLILSLVTFPVAFGLLQLVELSSWVSLWSAGAVTASTLAALLLCGRGKSRLFPTRRRLGVFMFLVGLGMLAVGVLLWYTTPPRAAAVISLLSGMLYIAVGVFETQQGARRI